MGTSTSYGQMTPEVPLGEDHTNHAASATLTTLVPGAVYHFRLVAKNTSSETALGADQMFTTTSPSLSPTTTTSTTTTPPPTTTTTTMPLVEPPPGPPLVGGPSLRSSQHGSSVRGSLDVSQAGAGGRLEVDLLAKNASLREPDTQSLCASGASFACPCRPAGCPSRWRSARARRALYAVITGWR